MSRSLLLCLAAFSAFACRSQRIDQASGPDLRTSIVEQQAVLFENRVFKDAVDFTRILTSNLIAPSLYQGEVRSSVTFRGCTFRQPVTAYRQQGEAGTITTFFSNLSFLDCTFEDSVSFRGSRVYGTVSFVGSTFEGHSTFEGINCYQEASFADCIFRGEARFQNSVFLQKAHFLRNEYYGVASFQQAIFHGEAQFGATKFLQYADLSLIDCRGPALFNYVEFFERATFGSAHFQRGADFLSVAHGQTNFDQCVFMGPLRCFKSTVREQLSFREAFFLRGPPVLSFLPAERVVMGE
jgi:uncharacterized protein YjbI with pentapeptide repeats